MFWVGWTLLFVGLHHHISAKKTKRNLDEFYKAGKKLDRIDLGNTRDFFTPPAALLYEKARDLAIKRRLPFSIALFLILLDDPSIRLLLRHIEVSPEALRDDFQEIIKTSPLKASIKEPDWMLLATLEAMSEREPTVEPPHIFMAVISHPHELIRKLIVKNLIKFEDLQAVSRWTQMRTRLRNVPRPHSARVKHQFMDVGFTARPTYYLDRFSDDLTDLARAGMVGFMVGHRKEYEEVVTIISQEARNNVLLMGPSGSGKMTIVQHLAREVHLGRVPGTIQNKRVVSVNAGALLAGLKSPGELQERLSRMINEITKAKNVILIIPELHVLTKATQAQEISFESLFAPVFQSIDFPTIATTDEHNYHRYIEPYGGIVGAFNTIKVKPLSEAATLKLLMALSIPIESQRGVTVGFFALKEAVTLAQRYLHARPLPGSAIDLLQEAVQETVLQRREVVTREIIREILSKKTGIPITAVGEKEAKQLLKLEKRLHQRIIGQNAAVKAVSEVLKEARVGLSGGKRPIAAFLFVGPTGVGKTEMAKTLADFYFHGKMHRFDMSEYQQVGAIRRLIGSETSGGSLTEAIKQNPFSLVLLDEFEKAHPDLINIFLQVFDDGRLTDELGNVVDFTNTIIICTSNAHSVLIKQAIEKKIPVPKIQALLKERLTDYFKPELINRFDEVIVFQPLSKKELHSIALLQLRELFVMLEKQRGMTFKITMAAIEEIVKKGYDPAFGARPMRHAIRKNLKSLIADKILAGELKEGSAYSIDFQQGRFNIVSRTS